METTQWLALAGIVLFAGVIRGCIGFGFSGLVVAAGTLFLLPSQVVPMVALLEIVASLQMARSIWANIAWKPLTFLLLGTAVATPLGVAALVLLPADLLRLLISLLILSLSLMLASGWRYQGSTGPVAYGSLGVFSGICNGAAAVGGLPVATFLAAADLPMVVLRATLVAFFFATDIIFIGAASSHGLYNQALLLQSALMVIPMFIGIVFGARLFNYFSEAQLKRGVIALLMLLSSIGLAKAASHYLFS